MSFHEPVTSQTEFVLLLSSPCRSSGIRGTGRRQQPWFGNLKWTEFLFHAKESVKSFNSDMSASAVQYTTAHFSRPVRFVKPLNLVHFQAPDVLPRPSALLPLVEYHIACHAFHPPNCCLSFLRQCVQYLFKHFINFLPSCRLFDRVFPFYQFLKQIGSDVHNF
jgi:hypothetical protein